MIYTKRKNLHRYFGISDAMNPFFTKLATAFPGATTLVDEAIA